MVQYLLYVAILFFQAVLYYSFAALGGHANSQMVMVCTYQCACTCTWYKCTCMNVWNLHVRTYVCMYVCTCIIVCNAVHVGLSCN